MWFFNIRYLKYLARSDKYTSSHCADFPAPKCWVRIKDSDRLCFPLLQHKPQRTWVCHGMARWRRQSPSGAPRPERGQGSWCRRRTLSGAARPLTAPWSWGALWTAGPAPSWSPHRTWSSRWSTPRWPASCSVSSSPLPSSWSYSASSATPR